MGDDKVNEEKEQGKGEEGGVRQCGVGWAASVILHSKCDGMIHSQRESTRIQ